MIYYLKGKITQINEHSVILENQGIGYEIFCKNPLAYSSNQEGVKFYIFERIAESLKDISHELFGFSTKEELEMLKILISVNRVGPKMALKILNSISIGVLIQAIENEDPSILPPVKSLGAKGIKRIINELKGKFPQDLKDKFKDQTVDSTKQSITNEAIEGLLSLGLNYSEAQNAIENAPQDIQSTGELIKWALKNRNT